MDCRPSSEEDRMNDEDRKALIINLRWLGKLDYEPEITQPCLKAAAEIERLAARLTDADQSLSKLVNQIRCAMSADEYYDRWSEVVGEADQHLSKADHR
jgi:hypothetical protein